MAPTSSTARAARTRSSATTAPDFIQCGQDFDSGKNPYYQPTPGWVMTGDFADGGGDTDVLPESVGLISDCEHTMNIP